MNDFGRILIFSLFYKDYFWYVLKLNMNVKLTSQMSNLYICIYIYAIKLEFGFYLKPLQLLLKYRIRYFDFLPTSHSDEDILILTQFNQRQSFYYKKFQTFLSNAKGLKITGRLGFKSIFYDLFLLHLCFKSRETHSTNL